MYSETKFDFQVGKFDFHRFSVILMIITSFCLFLYIKNTDHLNKNIPLLFIFGIDKACICDMFIVDTTEISSFSLSSLSIEMF